MQETADFNPSRLAKSLLRPAYQLQLLDAYGHLEGPRQKYLDLAERIGIPNLWHQMIELAESAGGSALEKVAADLPPGFPARVIDEVATGIRQQTRIFLKDARRL